ncbi:hypothetical protein [Francisella philomiragia]|uniref:Uncharacterized protein n=1 Tax=Francisella philomiragia TaxID=28110 RepID=A0ABS1GD81_9GAMM|nr:hypothetical protein [Francisella philomiragia]MBK2095697.1 hypothetical protein [Francisella philomiragia]MBK2105522.1 hypothetical protein [Francisella philomiragia]MBK2259167.1 hypothetical protein [Francisella philomiragia]MBK2302796.1 hypothetical protein [Francisella philomiragia]QUE31405.1 hypothetical protein IMS64_09380 [Francisella philomiragia]
MFSTVLSGVIVFVVSQYVLELMIKPYIEANKLYALISEEVLSNLAKITNGNIEDDTRKSLRNLGAKLVSVKQAYFIFSKKSKKEALSVAQQLNCIANTRKELDKNWCENIVESLNKLNTHNKIVIGYTS